MGSLSIKNERFSKYLSYKLNKDKMEVDDLYNIKVMTLNKNDFKNEVTDFKIDGVKYFKNLEQLYIKNFNITTKNIREICSLKKLEKLVFFNCEFEKNSKISKKLIDLEFLNCTNINNIKYVNTQSIKVSNTDIDFKLFKIINNVKNIEIFKCFLGFNIGKNNDKKVVINFKKSKTIKILNSNIDTNILFKFKDLQNLTFSNTQLKEYLKEYILKHDKKQNITLINDDNYFEFTKEEKGDVNV